MGVTQEITTEDSGELKVRCISCDAVTMAAVIEQRIVEKYYGMFALSETRQTTATCAQCGAKLLSKKSISDLSHFSADQIATHLWIGVSIVLKFLALAGSLLFFVPVFGLVMSLIAYFNIQKAAKGWKRLSWIGIVLAVIFHVFLLAMLLIKGIS